ncbi:MAG: hypothetical protein KA444_05715 [Bacteroidia bacterium]|nr:hypothetical protein [Bacteroidia bacterium]
MEKQPTVRSKKRTLKRILVLVLILLAIASIALYNNYNRLLSEALLKSFNSSLISEVYELKFEKLRVNLIKGNINVLNAELSPREKPPNDYPYINSSIRLTTKKIVLQNVQIYTLLKSSVLNLEKIEIEQPDIVLRIDGEVPILFPFKDTSATASKQTRTKKKSIAGFELKEFKLIHASIDVENSTKLNKFRIQDINISLNDLLIDQQTGRDLFAYKNIEIAIGEFSGSMEKGGVRNIGAKDFKLSIDSLVSQKTLDTLIFTFNDLNLDLSNVDIQTADSLFHFTMGTFLISYKNKYIKLEKLAFEPNVSNKEIQKRYKYQHTQFAATVQQLHFNNVNFDSLIYYKKIYIDEVILDSINAKIFKDNTKPVDRNRVPTYFGEQISGIPIPLLIKQVSATNVNLLNTERKPDGSFGKANINRATLSVKDITNLSPTFLLEMKADAYIENKVHFNLSMDFDYSKPQFSFKGKINKFNLASLNPLIQSYTPAKIITGVADDIEFSGMVYRTYSIGKMKFLYHDLKLDLELKEQAKWKSSVIAFAANTGLHASNPISVDSPPRVVTFQAERNMNKGFVNIVIKSVLAGLKETMIMSKENRKAHQKEKNKRKKKGLFK